MTLEIAAVAAREEARNKANGQFGAQEHTAPDCSVIPASEAAEKWAEKFRAAEDQLTAMIPLVERRFRDIADEVGRRRGFDELTFHFADTGDFRRVTLHTPDGEEIDEPELLDAMNSYVTALHDMRLFPGVERTDADPFVFTYRVR